MAGEKKDLQAALTSLVEERLELFLAVFVCVGKSIVENQGEAAVVVGGEELGHGKAQGEGDLFLGTVTQALKTEKTFLFICAIELQAFELTAVLGPVEPGRTAAEEKLEVGVDGIFKRLG